jgi:lipopolysaccharide/colanic/teichoic acid biosynthesis glycosyltransferase
MEPDILASPSEQVSGRGDWSTSVDPSAQPGARPMSSLTLPPPVVPAQEVAPALANGHAVARPAPATNGHGLNGHANGHVVWTLPAVGGDAVAIPRPRIHAPESLYLKYGKRLADIVGAALALIVTAPILLVAAIAIVLESRGPVLYRSTRIGRDRKPFTFLKLRSMVNGADRHRHRLNHLNEADGPVFKMSRDPRVTRVGRFLRVTSIDEIPQFWNVLRGEMSLVGPRPPIPEEVAQYEPWQLHRLDVRPGITCLWQISGRSRIGFDEWMRLDLEYIKHQSLGLDLKILLRTMPAVLSREGAY